VAEPAGMPRRAYRALKNVLRQAYWACLGKRIRNPELPGSIGSVLFVCKGNICRSAFAGRYLRKVARERDLAGIRSSSAGLVVPLSIPSPAPAVRVAAALGIDIADHRSKPVTAEMIEGSDVVFVMEHRQAVSLRKAFPEHASKIFLLSMFDTGRPPAWDRVSRYNIRDPYGGTENEFLECFRGIERSIEEFLSRVDTRRRA
jgi:protein-tyrosine-phosphatase